MLEQTVRPHWEGSRYCWVVLCKNRWFHLRHSFFFSHKIPLGITDDFAPCPKLDDHFVARCDECGKEHLYKPSEVRRSKQTLREGFTPHPNFW